MNHQAAFLDLVQLHERTWGAEQYAGRPTLAQLLSAPIVAVWSGKAEITVDPKQARLQRQPVAGKDAYLLMTTHQSAEELNTALTDLLLLRKVTPFAMRKLSKLYVNQKEVEIIGVKLVVNQK